MPFTYNFLYPRKFTSGGWWFRHSVMSDFCDLWAVVHQAPLSIGFSRQEYWSELPYPSTGDHPDPGIKPRTPALQADSLPSEPPGKPLTLL